MLGDVVFLTISIHAPREGCDFAPRNDGGMWVISIHAPREGCDCQNQGSSSRMDYFNPRTPRGVRRQRVCTISMGNRNFNPRTPRGVRQVADGPPGDCVIISIHAPREGCDKAPLAGGTKERNFNPRTPRGVRRSVMRSSICSNSISIHAPREGCDERPCCTSETGRHYFNPRTPRGVRRFSWFMLPFDFYFNPRTPRGVRPVEWMALGLLVL